MKHFSVSKVLLISIPVCILFACTCNTPEPTPNQNQGKGGRAMALQIPDYYEILTIDSSDFVKLKPFNGNGTRKGSLFLKHQVNQNFLGLSGWQFGQFNQGGANRPGFDTQPDVSFRSGGRSTIPIAYGMYLGDLVLGNTDVKAIIDSLQKKPGSKYVVLTPLAYGSDSSQIQYSITLSNSPTALEKDLGKEEPGLQNYTMSFYIIPIPPGGGNVLDDN